MKSVAGSFGASQNSSGCHAEDIAVAERLKAVKRARLKGVPGYTPDEFEKNAQSDSARSSPAFRK